MLLALAAAHDAARQFETKGAKAFYDAVKTAGTEPAISLLVSYVRRELASMQSWPIADTLDAEANKRIGEEFPELHALISKHLAAFYTGKWYALDNFSAFAVMYNGRLVPTVEHAYQASKFRDFTIVGEILNAPSAHEAKQIGNRPEYQSRKRTDWNEATKLAAMRPLLRDKRDRHEYVRRTLERSRGMYLVEDSHEDSFWGRGPNFDGENWEGRLWMELRDGPQ